MDSPAGAAPCSLKTQLSLYTVQLKQKHPLQKALQAEAARPDWIPLFSATVFPSMVKTQQPNPKGNAARQYTNPLGSPMFSAVFLKARQGQNAT